MARLIYVLDTNVIGDYINNHPKVTQNLYQAVADNALLYLCEPVLYEVIRGFLKVNATRKRAIFDTQLRPLLISVPLMEVDWLQSALFWATTTNQGNQLSDMDLLIASITKRLDATLITADGDFSALPVLRENWRI